MSEPWEDFGGVATEVDAAPWQDFATVAEPDTVKPGPRSEWPLQETPVESLSQQLQAPQSFPSIGNRIIEPNRAPMLQPVGEASATFGGPPKPVASFAETTQEVKEKMMEPRINMPKFTISDQDSKPVTFGKEVLNLALGIPEFLSSNAGLLSIVSGAVAPTATSAVFTVDMLNNLGQQVQAAYKDWDRMTPTQKTVAVADMVGTGVLTGMLAKHTTTGVLNKVVPARQVAEMINKAELTPNAQAAAESIGGNLPAIVRPGERQPALEIVKPVEEPKPVEPQPSQPISKAKPATPTVKEPWQMTKAEWTDKTAKEFEDAADLDAQRADANPPGTIKNMLSGMASSKRKIAKELRAGTYKLEPGSTGLSTEQHKAYVQKAVKENKPVPTEVLAEYPDLVAKPPPVAQGEAAQSAPPSAPAVSQAEPGVAAPEAQAISQAKPAEQVKQATETLPSKVEVAGAEFDVVGRNENGTLRLRSESGEFDTLPGEPWREVKGVSKSIAPALDTSKVSRAEFQKQEIDRIKSQRALALMEAENAIKTKWKPKKPLPVGVRKLQAFEAKSRYSPEERKLLTKLNVARQNNSVDLRNDFDIAGRVWDAIKEKQQPTQPTEQAAGGEMIGMGGARPGEVPQAPQIVQLTEEMNRIEGKKVPFGEKMKESFNLNEHRSLAQDAAGRALDALKATRDYIIKKWDGVSDWDQIKKVKGELSAEINTRGWSLKEFEKSFRKAIPSKADREAISSWLDTGGDPAKLQTALAETTPRYKASYQRAMNLSPELQTAANHIRSYFEARLQEAIDAGVVKEGIEDYIHRIYQRDTPVKRRILNQVQSGVLNTRTPGLAMQRAFEFDYEAEKAGYPIVKDALARVVDYERSLSRVIADRKAVKKFMEIKMPDGRPMVDVAGIGIPLENAEGVTEAMLIKPSFKRGDPNEPGSKNYRKDYLERNDYPAFRKWKWIDKDEATGRDVFLQGDVLVHPDAAQRIDALMARSSLRRSKALSAALGVSSAFKQTMLDFSGFHQVQIAVHGAEHRVQPRFIPQIPGFVKTIENINISDPKVQSLLKGGLEIGGDNPSVNYREGLVGRSLSRMIPGLGELMQSYHEYLFRDYIPRIKTTMALHALERNRQRFPNMSEEQLNYLTAKQANAAFGGLNYILMERSKTAQDLSRLILLAPDFLEARGAFAAQALQRVGKGDKGGFLKGNEQRQALLLGALTLYVTARIMNKLTDDQYHFEPENAFSVVHDGHAYSLRTVQGDLLHLWDKPFQFWLNRLNPVFGRSFLELGTGRDYFGRKRSRMELAWDLLANITPIAFRNSQERKLWESALNAFGVQAKRWSDIDDAFKLAQTWKEKNGVQERGEFIYDSEKDPLRPLKLALNDGDEGEAAKQIRLIFENNAYNRKKLNDYFRRYQSMPFTGSKSNDQKFMATLNEDQKQTVERARQHRRDIMHLYFKALGKYDSAMSKPQL